MTRNVRFYLTIVTSVLFVYIAFMQFLGYWKFDPTIQVLDFFIMVAAVFNAGYTTNEYLNNKNKS
ncbi:hypothetical protein ABE042_07395 [Viridibacillus arvi]|uniref:hypothetical protein n=1 Tax=Viridibacillus arvi TaxID=263475 RepID=UPI003D03D1C9